mgnify:CR=1 FL=1|tara:strand:- start:4186 stop:4719 length:534 start_codon:yes stop_codon:yes gene_type:complete
MKTKLIIYGILLILILGCSENKTSIILIPEKINPIDKIFDIKNLNNIGFKTNKKYDVTNLPKALSSYYGWIENEQGVLKDIEIRFYDSHEDALTYGFDLANEVTGKNAKISKKDVKWKEGNNDRRSNKRSGTGGLGPGSGKAKYGNFVIIGNMILLCEGSETTSLELCGQITIKLLP